MLRILRNGTAGTHAGNEYSRRLFIRSVPRCPGTVLAEWFSCGGHSWGHAAQHSAGCVVLFNWGRKAEHRQTRTLKGIWPPAGEDTASHGIRAGVREVKPISCHDFRAFDEPANTLESQFPDVGRSSNIPLLFITVLLPQGLSLLSP